MPQPPMNQEVELEDPGPGLDDWEGSAMNPDSCAPLLRPEEWVNVAVCHGLQFILML